MQTVQGTFRTFSVGRSFLSEIEKNEQSLSRVKLFEEVSILSAKHVSQLRGKLKYLCNASHPAPGNYSYNHYVDLFVHVQLNHHPLKPTFCLVCGNISLSCHFRKATETKCGGKGFTGNCKLQIDATNFFSRKYSQNNHSNLFKFSILVQNDKKT